MGVHEIAYEDAGDRGRKISDHEVRQHYANHGAILLRGIANSPDDFAAFTDRVGQDWLAYTHGTRDMVSKDKVIQTVDTKSRRILPHSELCYLPRQPHLACFFCLVPPTRGSATSIYDGSRIADEMPADLKAVFTGRSLRYRRRWPLAAAARRFGVEDEAALVDLIRRSGWESCLAIDSGVVTQDYLVPCFERHGPSMREVFVNQIVHNAKQSYVEAWVERWFAAGAHNPAFERAARWAAQSSRRYLRGKITSQKRGVCAFPTFEDGSIVPRWVVRKLARFIESCGERIEWGRGDVLVFDNRRCMHGREPVRSKERMILTRFGIPKW